MVVIIDEGLVEIVRPISSEENFFAQGIDDGRHVHGAVRDVDESATKMFFLLDK